MTKPQHRAGATSKEQDLAGPAAQTTQPTTTPPRCDWPALLAIAAEHVRAEAASLGVPPTLRRVHYLLVSDPAATGVGYRNTQGCYKGLSRETARARTARTFPALSDQTRSVVVPAVYSSEQEARDELAETFTLDRRPYSRQRVLVAVEKAGLLPLVRSRFAWTDVAAVKGYSSLTLAEAIGRYDVVIYAGDFDPSGLDIQRDLSKRSGVAVQRVALTWSQVQQHSLPAAPAKATDSRAAWMLAEHGQAVQVEVDALPPAVLLDAIGEAVQDATGLDLDTSGWPVLPEVDEEEQAIRARLRGESA